MFETKGYQYLHNIFKNAELMRQFILIFVGLQLGLLKIETFLTAFLQKFESKISELSLDALSENTCTNDFIISSQFDALLCNILSIIKFFL